MNLVTHCQRRAAVSIFARLSAIIFCQDIWHPTPTVQVFLIGFSSMMVILGIKSSIFLFAQVTPTSLTLQRKGPSSVLSTNSLTLQSFLPSSWAASRCCVPSPNSASRSSAP